MNDPCDFNNINVSFKSAEDYKIFENCSFLYNIPMGVVGHKKVVIAFQLMFYIIAALGNCLLLLLMYKDPLKRFRNSTSYLILNLCLADMLSIASGITETVIQLKPPSPRGDTQPSHLVALCFGAIGIQCSFLMIMVFSIDRYMAIGHAYTYKRIISNKCIVMAVLIIPWCFAIITLPTMYFTSHSYHVDIILTRVLAGNFIALCCITMTVHPYTHYGFLKKIDELRKSNTSHKQLLEENLKIAKVLSNTVSVVSICLMIFIAPYFIAFCFSVAQCDKCFLNDHFQRFWKYFPLISSVRVVVNNCVYTWRLPLYRNSLKALFPIHRNHVTVTRRQRQASETRDSGDVISNRGQNDEAHTSNRDCETCFTNVSSTASNAICK